MKHPKGRLFPWPWRAVTRPFHVKQRHRPGARTAQPGPSMARQAPPACPATPRTTGRLDPRRCPAVDAACPARRRGERRRPVERAVDSVETAVTRATPGRSSGAVAPSRPPVSPSPPGTPRAPPGTPVFPSLHGYRGRRASPAIPDQPRPWAAGALMRPRERLRLQRRAGHRRTRGPEGRQRRRRSSPDRRRRGSPSPSPAPSLSSSGAARSCLAALALRSVPT